MKIACLHTMASNEILFETAATAQGVEIRHVLRDDLLSRAEAAGGLDAEIRRETAQQLERLAADADAVLLTCSTLGPSVEDVATPGNVPVLRVDGALAEAAVAAAGPLVVLCTVDTTVGPTTALFNTAAAGRPVDMQVAVVPDAWAALKAGDREGYLDAIATAADDHARAGAATIAFAQASMTPAAKRCRIARPLVSPEIGLAAAVTAALSGR